MSSKGVRIARIAAIALVGPLLASLIGVNLLLATRMFRSAITSSSGSLLVDYRRAWSLWPGSVHVEGLVIRGRDSAVEWILSIDRCDFHVAIPELALRRFHAGPVRGEGLSLRIRLRRELPVTPEEIRALPPVPGFLDPPLKDVGPPPPPLTDANYDLWSIRLDDVTADHVRELWIDTARYAGDLDVHGRWFFRPLRWLDVGPATVTLRDLEASYGTIEPWLSAMKGELTATIHPTSLQEVEGAGMIDQVSIDGEVQGTARVANIIGGLVRSQDFAVDRAHDATMDARVHVDHGVVRSGTRLHLDRFPLGAHWGAVSVETSTTWLARADDGDRFHLDVECAECRIASRGSEIVRAQSVVMSAQTDALDLSHPNEGIDHSGSEVQLRNARVTLGGETATGDLRLDLRVRGSNGVTMLSGSRLTFDGTVGDARDRWWARAALPQATLDARRGLRFRVHATATAKNGSPLVDIVAKDTAIPASVLKLVSTEGLVAEGDVLMSPSTFEVRAATAHAAGIDVGFELAELGTEREWALLLDTGLLSAGVDVAGDHTDVLLFGARSWFAKKCASLRAVEQRYE